MEGGIIPAARKEQEPQPKVRVRFHGWRHHPLSIQAIQHVRSDISEYFEQSSGRNTIFLEAPTLTHAEAKRESKFMEQYGGAHSLIAGILRRESGRRPTHEEVFKRRAQIASSDLGTILREKLIPDRDIQRYYLQESLDELKQRYNFEIKVEGHSRGVVNKVKRLYEERSRFSHDAIHAWHEGGFSNAVENYKKFFILDARAIDLRDEETTNDFRKRKVRDLLRDKTGGSLFILYGLKHLPMISRLQGKVKDTSKVKFEGKNFGSDNSLIERIQSYIEKGEAVPDSLYAQEFFKSEILMHHALQHGVFEKKKDLVTFTKNYESIFAIADQVASSLSLAEIRYLCESKTDVVEFLRAHPLAEPLKQYIV